MDHFVECDGFFTEREAENVLYSLVHHGHSKTEDITEFNIENEYSINRKNKALRWNAVQGFSDSSDLVGGLSHSVESNEILDYVPLDSSAKTNSSLNKTSFGKRGPWSNRKNKKNWNGPTSAKFKKSFIRNLVSINIDTRDVSMKSSGSPKSTSSTTTKNNSPVVNRNLSSNSSSQGTDNQCGQKSNKDRVNVQDLVSDSLNSTVAVKSNFTDKKNNESIQKLQDDVIHKLKNDNLESVQQSSGEDVIIIDVSSESKQSTPGVNNVGEKVVTEILTLSDSEDSNDSIIEVSVPPKPDPPLIALDSSDETEKIAISLKNPILNVIDNQCQKVDKKVEIKSDILVANIVGVPQCEDDKAQITSNSANSNSQDTVNVSAKILKKKKRKKKKKRSFCLGGSTPCAISMHQFYNQSWGGESFDHVKMQQAMTDNPSKWQILEVDKYGPLKNRGPLAKVRCANCHQFGHFARDCPDPQKIISCFMCGMPGHTEYKCPYKICLKCGRPATFYNSGCPLCWSKDHPPNCSTCGDKEHYSWMCPNVWRKLHSVTTADEMNTVNSQAAVYKPSEEQSCCFCAKQGHNSSNCPYLSTSYGHESDMFINPSYSRSPRGKKRKKTRNSSFDWKWKDDFHRKRRKTN